MDLTERIELEVIGLFMFSPIFLFAGIIYILQAPLFGWSVILGYIGLGITVHILLLSLIFFLKDITLYIKAKRRIRGRKWMNLNRALELIKKDKLKNKGSE